MRPRFLFVLYFFKAQAVPDGSFPLEVLSVIVKVFALWKSN